MSESPEPVPLVLPGPACQLSRSKAMSASAEGRASTIVSGAGDSAFSSGDGHGVGQQRVLRGGQGGGFGRAVFHFEEGGW